MAGGTPIDVPGLHSTSKWWWQDPGLRQLYFLLLIAILSSATNGYDGSMMNGLQALTYWKTYFHNPHGSTQGILNAIQSVGAVCSLPIAPNLADWYGRHKSILVGSLVVALGAGLQSGARNSGMFIAGRFFIGMGSGINGIASPLLITELAHPKQRGIITSCYNIQYYLGSTFAAWITFGTLQIKSNWSWRLPSLLQVAPSAIQIALIWLLPESPRWLISKDRHEEALVILAKYHSNGDVQDEAVQFEYAEIRASIRLDKEASKGRFMDLFSTVGNRKRLFICVCCGMFPQLSGTGLTGYYLSKILTNAGITDPEFQDKLNGIIATTNWLEAIFFALLVDRLGRRPLFLTSNTGMIFTFAIWITLTAIQNRTGVSLNVAYPVEILPYQIRAMGLMVQSVSTSLALFFGQYINPIGIDNSGWRFYLLYECWLVLELVVVYFFFVETRGATLEEIARTFDGETAVEDIKEKALEIEKIEHIEQIEHAEASNKEHEKDV